MKALRTWTIGSGADCDLVVAKPTVSSRHCRLTEVDGGYIVEDLAPRMARSSMASGSSRRLAFPQTMWSPWSRQSPCPGLRPAHSASSTFFRIGRSSDNDIVFDDPRVSSHHCRLIVSGSQTLIEDLGSANGTFVNSPTQRATTPIPLTESDIVGFGSLIVPAAQILTKVAVLVQATRFTAEP